MHSDSIREQLRQLEAGSRILEPDRATMQNWSDQVAKFAADFVQGMESGPAFRIGELPPNGPYEITSEGVDLAGLLAGLDRLLLQNGLNPASGGHLGYIPGGGLYPCALGDFLAAVTNQYAGMFFAGPGAVRLEHDLVRWMNRLVGFPQNALGNLTSGGSIANLIAFVTARDAMGINSKKVCRAVIYLTDQVHHCVHKAIRIGGLSEATVRRVPMDNRFRLNARALNEAVEADLAAGLVPFLVVASAGTTDTGAVDPLQEIATICQRHNLWLHVDAAYGGFFLLADDRDGEGRTIDEKFQGIELANSIAIDPHKGLFLSYGLGAILVRDVDALHRSHHYRASYMQDTLNAIEEPNPADLSPELTKHFRGLRMWLPLKVFGLKPFRAALREKLWLCRLFYAEAQKMGFEVGPYPELSVCIYRFVPRVGDANQFNLNLVEEVKRDGRVFISSTTIEGVVWLRLAVLCFRTHQREIDTLLEVLGRATRGR